MKKLILFVTLVLVLGLVSCSKDTTVKCVGNDREIEWTWNNKDGFVELVTDGVVESADVLDEANNFLEESEFQTIEEFMNDFIFTIEANGYECD